MKRLVFSIFCLTLLLASCKDECKDVICFNGGVCVDGTCACPPGFEGADCGLVIDPCSGVVCNNGGSCDDGTCICLEGYEGEDCSVESRDKFLGSWQGPMDDCFPAGGGGMMGENPIITITKNNADVNMVDVMIGNELFPLETTGSVDGNMITVDEGTADIEVMGFPITITFSGSGEIINNDSQVTMDLSISIPLVGDTDCTVLLDRI